MKKIILSSSLVAVVGLSVFLSSQTEKPKVLRVDDDGAQCAGSYTTIAAAVGAASPGDTIQICTGEYSGVLLTKSLHFEGLGQARITNGPAHPSGLSQGFRLNTGSNGSSFSHLAFETDLSIINGQAVDNVTVENNTFLNSIQAISNWRGAKWNISHNDIVDLRTRCGGGIGILIGDYANMNKTQDNVVAHNKISGVLDVSINDCGGYNGSGIVLYADHRFGRSGGDVFNNTVVDNKVDLKSDNPALVDVVAFELTDTRDDSSVRDIFDNSIGFNDFRKTDLQIVLTPSNLDQFNNISKNLGENRGHGLHPSVFKPE